MSDRLEDVVDIALRVPEALEKVGASYFVGGSLASSIDGDGRARVEVIPFSIRTRSSRSQVSLTGIAVSNGTCRGHAVWSDRRRKSYLEIFSLGECPSPI